MLHYSYRKKTYWQNIIAVVELQKKVTFYEVKRQAKDVNIGILKDKAEKFFEATGKFLKFDIEYKGLSLDDMLCLV